MTPFFVSTTIQPELAEISNTTLLERYAGPLLMLVGNEDDTTPVKFSQKLYQAAASERKTLAVIPGRDHGYSMESDKAIERYRRFIETLE